MFESERHKHSFSYRCALNRLQAGEITRGDCDLINAYVTEHRVTNDITVSRADKIRFHLLGWRRFVGPFDALTWPQVLAGMVALREGTSRRGRRFAPNTIRDYIIILRQFLLWMADEGLTDIPADKIQGIRVPRPPKNHSAGDVLSAAEVGRLIAAAQSLRDRCILTVMYEGALRVGEVMALSWADVVIDGVGVVLNICFKTGRPRYIRLITARSLLLQYRALGKCNNGKGRVFCKHDGGPLTHAAMLSMVKRAAKNADLGRHVTPHMLRHARITHMLQEGYSDTVVKLMAWGSVDASEFATYAHLTGRDVEREVLKHHGIDAVIEEEEEETKTGTTCPYCGTIAPLGSRYCPACGRPLVLDDVMAELHKLVTSNPEVVEVMQSWKA